MWMDHETLDNASTFVPEGDLDRVFTEVGPSFDFGVLVFEKDKMMCSKYDRCVIHLYECCFLYV